MDVAVMDFAEKAAAAPASITADDVAELRRHGLSDDEVFQIALAAAARCFFSTVLDATGTAPDPQFLTSLEPGLRRSLTFGRPVG